MIGRGNLDLASIEGETFIIGREGHIYLHDDTVSRKHASISIVRGQIHLVDLDSRNGTYLVKKGGLHLVDDTWVSPLQTLLIGDRRYRVADLLSIACKFYGGNANPTLVKSAGRIEAA